MLPIPQCHLQPKSCRCWALSMRTRFLLAKDKMLRPNQKWTDGNRIKVSDIQFNQDQEEEPIDDITYTRMTMVSPGAYAHLQFTAIEQQQVANLKNPNRSHIFTCPQTQSFSDPVRRWNPIPDRGVQYNGSLPYPNQSRVIENYHQTPPDAKTLTPSDAVSEMKRWPHFLDQCLNKIQNSLSELQLVSSATPKSTMQGFNSKQMNLWSGNMQGPVSNAPLIPSKYLSDPFDIAYDTKTKEVHFSA